MAGDLSQELYINKDILAANVRNLAAAQGHFHYFFLADILRQEGNAMFSQARAPRSADTSSAIVSLKAKRLSNAMELAGSEHLKNLVRKEVKHGKVFASAAQFPKMHFVGVCALRKKVLLFFSGSHCSLRVSPVYCLLILMSNRWKTY